MSEIKQTGTRYRTFALLLMTVVYGFNFIDRQIVGILAPFIQKDLDLSNTQLGLLIGLAFATFYTVIAIPIAWLADRYSRVNILSIALATWSGFTALTGLTTNFVQIGLARMGVGIGEAGGSPPSHSIISDMFAKEERSAALGIYSIGIPLGIMAAYFTAASLIGADVDSVNWRRIFIILGLAGIALAVIVKVFLREPERGAMETEPNTNKDIVKLPFKESLAELLKIHSWWYMAFGAAFASFVTYSLSAFQTKYLLVLDPNFNFKTALIVIGIIYGTTSVLGTYFGAKMADVWGAKDIRAYGWLPAMAICCSLIVAFITLSTSTVPMYLMCNAILMFFLGIYLGPSFAIAQTLAPINMRAMSSALYLFILNMIGLGCGPTFTGFMIDFFLVDNSRVEAIRFALYASCMFFIPSIIGFAAVSSKIKVDWQRAEQRNEGLV